VLELDGPTRCWSCGAAEPEVFHSVPQVPVHDTVVLSTAEQALAFPTGELRLAVCRTCGLVQNTAFDAALLDYGSAYEESQSHSPRFARFTAELVARLVAAHDLTGGSVLEVGCGKGDFLAELCRATGGDGLGFDPVFDPSRHDDPAARWRVLPRRFGPEDTGREADLVVCRHTLEHVPDVAELLGLLVRTAGRRPGAAVYLEVPDVLRVLREGAFWDVYYEHCSYFTAGSLADLSMRCGLVVDRLELVFDQQYLALEGRAAAPAVPDRSHVPDLLAAVERFRREVEAVRGRWRQVFDAHADRGDEVVVWGASSKAVGFLTTLAAADGPPVRRLVDVNPHKHGRYLPGLAQPVVAPEDLRSDPPALVVAMNPVYRDEIRADLDRLGVPAALECV
jgi:SAM-dependent methyltransferase